MRASVGKSARPVTTLSGYLRPSGRVGFRNHVLVLPLTGCMSEVGRRIADEVPGAVAVPHMLGCGQFGPDLDLFAATSADAREHGPEHGGRHGRQGELTAGC